MLLKYSKYNLGRGLHKVKTRTALALSAVTLAVSGGTGLSLLSFGAAHASPVDTTTVVTQSDLTNTPDYTHWFMYNDSTDTIDNTLGSFVNGPGTPPNGTGSVSFTLGASPNDRKNIATYQFAGTKLADITNLTFTAYSASGVAGPNESPYLNFNVDFNGSDTWQKRLVYVPSANLANVPQDTWNTYDTIAGGTGMWTWSGYDGNGSQWPDGNTSRYRSWSDILAAFPDAGTRTTDSWFGVRVGEPGPAGYTGAVDAVSFGTADGIKTFDFEQVHQSSGVIKKPVAGAHYMGTLKLKALYDDGGTPGTAAVQWAVREGTCAAGTNTVFGNVDGKTDAYQWDGSVFKSTLDIRAAEPGMYCFVFNPTDAAGQNDVRLTRTFFIDAYVPQDKEDCKDGGWKTYLDPSFRNQGQCVSWVNHHDGRGHDDDRSHHGSEHHESHSDRR